jgi:septal ring factor EnvC (AmiA/AmiB activator)
MAELGYWIGDHPFAATVILVVFLIAVVMAITSTVKYKKEVKNSKLLTSNKKQVERELEEKSKILSNTNREVEAYKKEREESQRIIDKLSTENNGLMVEVSSLKSQLETKVKKSEAAKKAAETRKKNKENSKISR